jgi:ElaB/YqjD/DUF883 family membrane-anchored ribosome-binding protein
MTFVRIEPVFYEFPTELLVALWTRFFDHDMEGNDIYTVLDRESCRFFNGKYQDFYNLLNVCPVPVRRSLKRFPFPHLLARAVKSIFSVSYPMVWGILRQETGALFLRMGALRKARRLIVDWTRTRKQGVLLLRNRKDRLPDLKVAIRFHPQVDTYFDAAFSGRFPKDLEDGCFVVHTKREGTTQRALQIYWEVYRNDKEAGAKALFAYLDDHKTDVNGLTEAMGSVAALEKYDPWGHFVALAHDYLDHYLQKTLYHKSFKSLERIYRFLTHDPVLAGYIWGVNFHTEKQRFALAADLGIAVREQKKFIQAQTMDDLRAMLEKKKELLHKRHRSIYDNLPDHLKQQIQTAQERHKKALTGTRVGLYGVYYSSEEIEASRQNAKEAWRRADQWIGKNINGLKK